MSNQDALPISLIVPVYNAQEWLPRCLDSLQAQTFSLWECILVNDGSTDQSPALCDARAAADPRFRVIHQPNGGASHARNAGMLAARGEFIVFCDDDDIISPCMLEWAWQLHQAHPQDVISWAIDRNFVPGESRLAEKIDDNAVLEKFPREKDHVFSLIADYSSVVNKLFPADVLRDTKLQFDPNLTFYEDHTFMRAFSGAYFARHPDGAYRYLKVPLYGYVHQNENSLSSIAEDFNIELEAGYLTKILPECNENLAHWKPGDDPAIVGPTMLHYMTALAYGLYCAHKLGEATPHFFQCPQLQQMLAWCKENRVYNGLYLAFRLRQKWLVRLIYQEKKRYSGLYWKWYELGYHLCCRGWQRQ